MNCFICGRELNGEFFTANIDADLKKTDEGVSVCSMDCGKKYEKQLKFNGRPLDRYSRITGYYQNIEGWNDGKLQELKDRKKYDI